MPPQGTRATALRCGGQVGWGVGGLGGRGALQVGNTRSVLNPILKVSNLLRLNSGNSLDRCLGPSMVPNIFKVKPELGRD